MFSKYTLTLGNRSDSYQFVYELEQHRPAQEWARIMQFVHVESLRPTLNPWHGLSSSTDEKVNRLNELIDLLNSWLPTDDKINSYWDSAAPQESLNRLHIHFPQHENNQTDSVKWLQLTEYNDTIHGLEDIIRTSAKEYIWLLLLILPNREIEIELEDADYTYFHPDRFFGELCLHYPQVGRHPLELVKAQDFTCPIDQIKSQNIITSYHTLRFYDDATADHYKDRLNDFYHRSTLKQVYDINDPKLAFGSITLGRLTTVNGNILSKEEVLSVVKATNKILGWTIS